MAVHIPQHEIKIDNIDEDFDIHQALSCSHLAIVLCLTACTEMTGVN